MSGSTSDKIGHTFELLNEVFLILWPTHMILWISLPSGNIIQNRAWTTIYDNSTKIRIKFSRVNSQPDNPPQKSLLSLCSASNRLLGQWSVQHLSHSIRPSSSSLHICIPSPSREGEFQDSEWCCPHASYWERLEVSAELWILEWLVSSKFRNKRYLITHQSPSEQLKI